MVVEDGTGLATADAYIDVAFFDSFLGATLAATDAALKETAITVASSYADARWGTRLLSYPLVKETQALEMPRFELCNRYGVPIVGVPTPWKQAVALYASYYLAGNLYPTTPDNAAGGASASAGTVVKEATRTVGPITKTDKFFSAAELESSSGASSTVTADGYFKFTQADTLVKPYLKTSDRGRVIR